MSLNLTQYPSGYCFLNKVTELVMTANDSVTMSLTLNPNGVSEEVFFGRYHPNFAGVIFIDLTDIVRNYVKSTVPTNDNDYVQTDFFKEFQYKIEEDNGGQATGTFKVANSAVNTSDTLVTWCASNFLTHQAAQKRTNYESPEWLTYFDLDGQYYLKVRFYKKTGGYVEAVVKTDGAVGCYTVNVGYSRLIRLVNMLPSQLKGYYDLILCYQPGRDEVELTQQRYLYHERSGKEHYYLFVNPQGGIDTIIADGANVLNPDMTLNYGKFGFRFVPIDDADNIRMWNQAFSIEWKERYWVHGLMATRGEAAVYFVGAKAYEKIVVVGTSFSMSDNGQLAPTSFDYILSEATQVMLASEERSRGFSQSAADATEELHDETTKVFVAFSQGATEPVVIPSALLYVLFDIDASEKTEPVYYFVDGDKEGEFTPGEDESPVQLSIKAGGSVHFETEGSLASLELRYYPTNIV